MISFLLAVLGHAYLPSVIWGFYFLLILSLGVLVLWCRYPKFRSNLVFSLIGFIVSQWHAVDGLSKTLPMNLVPQDLEFEGRVINLQPRSPMGYQSLLIKIEGAPSQLVGIDRVRLGLYDSVVRIEAGDRIKVLAKVGPLTAYQNEFSPDRRRKEFAQGIGGSG